MKIKFDDFIKELQEYESDTFSADGTNITIYEAQEIAERMLFDLKSEYVDGGSIALHLVDIRDVDEIDDLYDASSEVGE